MATDVKQTMIERTAILLAKKGLQGASFSEILAASGAPRGSLYHHFPGGKDELVLAAIGAAGDRAINALAPLAGRPATDITEAFLGLWRMVLQRSGFTAGCAVAAVAIAAETPALLDRAAEVFRSWRTQIAELLTQGGVPAAAAPALAATLISATEGAVILSRAERSMDVFELVASAQLHAIASQMDPAGVIPKPLAARP